MCNNNKRHTEISRGDGLLQPVAGFPVVLAGWTPDNAEWVILWPGVAKGCLWCCCSGSAWQAFSALSLRTSFPTPMRLMVHVLCPILYSLPSPKISCKFMALPGHVKERCLVDHSLETETEKFILMSTLKEYEGVEWCDMGYTI